MFYTSAKLVYEESVVPGRINKLIWFILLDKWYDKSLSIHYRIKCRPSTR